MVTLRSLALMDACVNTLPPHAHAHLITGLAPIALPTGVPMPCQTGFSPAPMAPTPLPASGAAARGESTAASAPSTPRGGLFGRLFSFSSNPRPGAAQVRDARLVRAKGRPPPKTNGAH